MVAAVGGEYVGRTGAGRAQRGRGGSYRVPWRRRTQRVKNTTRWEAMTSRRDRQRQKGHEAGAIRMYMAGTADLRTGALDAETVGHDGVGRVCRRVVRCSLS